MAQISSFQAFTREVGEVDLPPGRFALLTLIGRNPGISQTVLSRAAGRDKSTLTPALQDLKRRGLIARVRREKDQRSYQLTLTPAGEAMLQRLTACAERHERNLDRVIGTRDRARFLHLAQDHGGARVMVRDPRAVIPEFRGGEISGTQGLQDCANSCPWVPALRASALRPG